MTRPDETPTIPQDPAERETLPPSPAAPGESPATLVKILDQYMADLQAGKAPDREGLLAAHPELARQLDACLGGIEFIHRATHAEESGPAVLGDFRILREVGRGGMGVVYEAEQVSLKRRVALKVLRLGVVADEEALRRFQREAETVARLHHTNIVPIFAVGGEGGVHYYAMQFIDGRSLADVLDQSQASKRPLDPDDVVRWGLQAAEALAHAHQRGVIHRDIKPSNLLLDAEGVVWLTDFGLAKRADEATLTLSGTLMGTPRYMSPEQAESLHRPIDHRTDLYSLGASLYELATGRPVFQASTPHGIIAQILADEPARPRQVRPSLPRDLETIILTCLAKDPARRYPTAQALADDLRAVLDARPIRARRLGPIGRAVRFVKKQRKAVAVAAVATADSVLLMVGAFFGWRAYHESLLGHVLLTTDGPALRGHVLEADRDVAVTDEFDIGRSTPIHLPGDIDYRLRVAAPGEPSQTFRMLVDRGGTKTLPVRLDARRLWPREGIEAVVVAPVTLDGRNDLIVAGSGPEGNFMVRQDAAGKVVWDTREVVKVHRDKGDPDGATALSGGLRRLTWTFGGGKRDQPQLLRDAPDLNGDGTGDLVWAIPRQAELVAFSGRDATLLWDYAPAPNTSGLVVVEPAGLDLDDDEAPDLIATHEAGGTPANVRLRVEAVSGRSGRPIWSRPLRMPILRQNAVAHSPAPATVILLRGRPMVAAIDGTSWVGLDPATGEPIGEPIELPSEPIRPVQYADLDGDGEPEAVVLLGDSSRKLDVVALSLTGRGVLWTETNPERFSPRSFVTPIQANFGPPSEWPKVVDLDGDRRPEVIVPVDRSSDPGPDRRGVRILDGATGRERWRRGLTLFTQSSIQSFDAGPDLDGDGTREVFVASFDAGRHEHSFVVGQEKAVLRVFVDALSGRDGHPLWRWQTPAPRVAGQPHLQPLRWWSPGPDGRPRLVVAIVGDGSSPDAVAHVLEAGTGRLLHTIGGLERASVDDLDGDGLADLWGVVAGRYQAFAGEPADAWRALGHWEPGRDYDGDAIRDAVAVERFATTADDQPRPRALLARSGADGRLLWRTPLDATADRERGHSWNERKLVLDGGDLDGDGAADLLVAKSMGIQYAREGNRVSIPLDAYSGRTGRLLWSAGRLDLGAGQEGFTEFEHAECRDLDGDGRPEVLVWHANSQWRPPTVPANVVFRQSRLALLAGRDGRVIWDASLVDRSGPWVGSYGQFAHAVADLDGDGRPDVAAVVHVGSPADHDATEIRALALADGRRLWSHPVRRGPFATVEAGDLDGDGAAEVVLVDRAQGAGPTSIAAEVTALDGRSGKPRWSWKGEDFASLPAALLPDPEAPGRRLVVVNALVNRSTRPARELVALGDRGGVRMRRAIDEPTPKLRALDLDGDGRDELLAVASGPEPTVRALRASDLRQLWSRRLLDTEAVRDVRPGGAGRPTEVVASDQAGDLLGLDGRDGHPTWRVKAGRSLLDPGAAARPPRVLAGPDDQLDCRLAAPTSADGKDLPLTAGPRAFGPLEPDPRFARPLPWTPNGGFNSSPRLALAYGAAALLFFGPPLLLVRWASRRRVFSLRMLLALPAIVALWLAEFQAARSLGFDRGSMAPPWFPFLTALVLLLVGLPVATYLGMLGAAIVRRRPRRLAWIVGSTLVLATVMAAGWLVVDRRTMGPAEYYVADDWADLFVPAGYGVGALWLLWLIARSVGRALAWGWRKLRRKGKPRP